MTTYRLTPMQLTAALLWNGNLWADAAEVNPSHELACDAHLLAQQDEKAMAPSDWARAFWFRANSHTL